MLVARRQIGWAAMLAVAAAALVVSVSPQALAEQAADNKAAPTTQASGNNATGTWTWTQEGPGGEMEMTLVLKQDGEKLTGTVSGFGGEDWDIEDGKINDAGEFTFKVTREFGGQQMVTTYTGKVAGNALTAKSETTFSRKFEAKRAEQAQQPAQPAQPQQ